MRFVPSLPPLPTSPDSRPVKGMVAANAVKPVYPRDQSPPYVEPHAAHQEPLLAVGSPPHPQLPAEDRRKICRRVSHQPVLEELRSGIERRRHNLFENGGEEHIDVEA